MQTPGAFSSIGLKKETNDHFSRNMSNNGEHPLALFHRIEREQRQQMERQEQRQQEELRLAREDFDRRRRNDELAAQREAYERRMHELRVRNAQKGAGGVCRVTHTKRTKASSTTTGCH